MFARILVPVDFTDVTPRPLRVALELAGVAPERLITLLAVVDDSFPNPDIMSFQLPWADYHRHLRDEARCRLEGLRAETGAGERVEVCVVRGHPARAIVAFAEEERCDLIVMATHGTRGFQHALLGSVTDKVIRQVRCPVLVVRLHEPHEAPNGAPPRR
ncbi:MAG TPA: universal stress protein [Thermoanaerobaculaceae bacterium]|nr:universal stress protein [Thermoanaerobaculaceae bacterium]